MARAHLSWKRSAKRRRMIRALVKRSECLKALRAYKRLPSVIRYDDRLGPLKASINSCRRR